MQPIHYVIILLVLIILFLAVIRANKKDFKLEINKLVEYLGGKDNIVDTEVEMSRFKVTLKDVSKANKEGIMKLGAMGSVYSDMTISEMIKDWNYNTPLTCKGSFQRNRNQ